MYFVARVVPDVMSDIEPLAELRRTFTIALLILEEVPVAAKVAVIVQFGEVALASTTTLAAYLPVNVLVPAGPVQAFACKLSAI